MSKFQTVNDLLDQVRVQIDEENSGTISDSELLQAMNRAQDYAANILARHYEEPLLVDIPGIPTAGVDGEITLPEDMFEDRLEKVEITVGQYQYEVKRVSYRDISSYEGSATSSIPRFYYVIGKKLRLLPKPNGTHNLRIWYLKDPDPLVKEEGRITYNNGSDTVALDAIGQGLGTSVDSREAFVNVIDGQSGIIKGTLQIAQISGDEVKFKTTGFDRSSVYGRTVQALSALTIEVDDFLCNARGVCIPFFKKPTSNFIIQFAVAEISRKLGSDPDIELRVRKDFEDQVKHSWVGREQSLRVKKRSKFWPLSYKRYFNTSD